MNKKGGMAITILVLLVVVVLTSATILLLIQYGVLNPSNEGFQEPILNADFLPFGREGAVVVKAFSFCSYVDDKYDCLEPRNSFDVGERVYFRFTVETSPYSGDIVLIQNYRLLGPRGNVILEADEKDSYHFNLQSEKGSEDIYFRDFIITEESDEPGLYTFELLLTNSVLDKSVKVVEEFVLNE